VILVLVGPVIRFFKLSPILLSLPCVSQGVWRYCNCLPRANHARWLRSSWSKQGTGLQTTTSARVRSPITIVLHGSVWGNLNLVDVKTAIVYYPRLLHEHLEPFKEIALILQGVLDSLMSQNDLVEGILLRLLRIQDLDFIFELFEHCKIVFSLRVLDRSDRISSQLLDFLARHCKLLLFFIACPSLRLLRLSEVVALYVGTDGRHRLGLVVESAGRFSVEGHLSRADHFALSLLLKQDVRLPAALPVLLMIEKVRWNGNLVVARIFSQ